MKNLNFKSLYSFVASNPTEADCRNYFRNLRWANGITCPHCSNSEKKIYEFKDGLTFMCSNCKKQFSLTKGTIFERTHIPLTKWFLAILMFLDKKSCSANYISRELDIAYPNAYHLLQRIRKAMNNYKKPKLDGVVEIDECFIGGANRFRHANKKHKNSQGRCTKYKAPLIGMLSRGGELRLLALQRLQQKSLQLLIRNKIEYGATISTDEYRGFSGLGRYYNHGKCNHGKGEYVSGTYHTNSLEGVWGHFKRAIKGVYHQVNRYRLYLYCFEYAFRYNTRSMNCSDKFHRFLSQTVGVRLTRKELMEF